MSFHRIGLFFLLCSIGAAAQSFWTTSTIPGTPTTSDTSSVTLGLQFYSDVPGTVTGLRFYKGTGNKGTHVGNLWSSTGTKLASVTFTGETTSGWQKASFASPINITAATVYTISYLAPQGHYADDTGYGWGNLNAAPLHVSGTSPGVYVYGSTAQFPTNTWNGSNYWVDVVFVAASQPPPPPVPVLSSVSPSTAVQGSAISVTLAGTGFATGAVINVPAGVTVTNTVVTNSTQITATFTISSSATSGSISVTISGGTSNTQPFTVTVPTPVPTLSSISPNSGTQGATVAVTLTGTGFIAGAVINPPTGVTASNISVSSATTITATFNIGTSGTGGPVTVTTSGGTSNSQAFTAIPPNPVTMFWPPATIPTVPQTTDMASVNLGLQFYSDVAGAVTALRFYKGANNTGTHIGNLWSADGVKLGEVTFSGESTSGWQQVNLPSPVGISANTVYTVSYLAPVGQYAGDQNYAWASLAAAPLHISGVAPGVFVYGSTSAIPGTSWNASNYWVDLVFSAGAVTQPHSVALSWTASTSTNVVGYNVYRSSTSGGPYAKVNGTVVGATTYTDSGVASNQTYYYVATAVDSSSQESPYSNQATAVVPN